VVGGSLFRFVRGQNGDNPYNFSTVKKTANRPLLRVQSGGELNSSVEKIMGVDAFERITREVAENLPISQSVRALGPSPKTPPNVGQAPLIKLD
jgi:hypothetical protein